MSGRHTRLPAVSVVIAAFSDARWHYLCDAVASVLAQTRPAIETVVVIDHNLALLARARRELPAAKVIPNSGARGASGARNTGVAACHGDVLAFLDDDARASAGWLEALLRHFADEDVVGVGGRVNPLWATARPRWFPPEFDWTIGASYRGMPQDAGPVRNVWSNNMAIRRSAFEAAGGFREDFGKVGARSRPEDTDLSATSSAGAFTRAGGRPGWPPWMAPERAPRPKGTMPGTSCRGESFAACAKPYAATSPECCAAPRSRQDSASPRPDSPSACWPAPSRVAVPDDP
jgi:hypothetical protein